MQYLMPFDSIKRDLHLLASQGTVRVNVTYDEFLAVIKKLLAAMPVDETWYRTTYPDVAEAIKSGVHTSAKEHFVEHGYFEGRLPYEMAVDETWYLRTYPDVADGLKRGDHVSAADHFLSNGYREGRQPFDPSQTETTAPTPAPSVTSGGRVVRPPELNRRQERI